MILHRRRDDIFHREIIINNTAKKKRLGNNSLTALCKSRAVFLLMNANCAVKSTIA